jgi:hypothetical protein
MAVLSGTFNSDLLQSMQLGYTYLVGRDQTRGFSGSTAGDPSTVEWVPASQDGQHRLTLSNGITFARSVQLQFFATATSGSRYTPRVAGDINGDGLSNDRAFVFDPSMSNDATSAGMASLLANGARQARSCLESQIGQIARANSCRNGWSYNMNAHIGVVRGRYHLPSRLAVGATLYNALAAADVLLHGSARARGWGQSRFADPTLLTVRGFDASAQRFIYAVNPRFGETRRSASALWSPFRLTVHATMDVGPDRRRTAIEAMRHGGVGRIPQPRLELPELITSLATTEWYRVATAYSLLWGQRDSIQMTQPQRDSLAALVVSVRKSHADVMTPLAQYLLRLGDEKYSIGDVQKRIDAARAEALVVSQDFKGAMRAVLTRDQLEKLSPAVRRQLDPTSPLTVLEECCNL